MTGLRAKSERGIFLDCKISSTFVNMRQELKLLGRYLAGLSLDSGWLVIFDQRSQQPKIADRTSTEETQTESGRQVVVIWA